MPGASHVMGPRAIVRRRGRHPELELYINILRIEEALDDILLGQGEVAVMGYRLSHPSISDSFKSCFSKSHCKCVNDL
jgi:hypothetical protein